MITFFVLVLGFLLGISLAIFLLGFRLGGDHWQQELGRVRLDTVRAERQLHELTRAAFEAMADTVHRRRSG